MGLKLKDGIDANELRKYGFKRGREFFGKERWCGESGIGYGYVADWMIKFLMDVENPELIAYTDTEFDIPMVEIAFRTDEKGWNDLYIDCAPSCTYHISGSDLDIVTDTIFELTQAGLVEIEL